MRKALVLGVACACAALAIVLVGSSASGDSGGIITIRDAVSGKLLPQSIPVQVNGKTVNRRLPFISNGTLQGARDAVRVDPDGRIQNADPASDADLIFGATPTSSLGCGARNPTGDPNVRANQDCTFRRQAEEEIAFNPADSTNLVAGQNDSRVGFNQCGIDWSTDGGATWGDLLPPFRQHVNSPQFDGPNTIIGGAGTLHTYDAGSDPTVAFDGDGNAYFSCVVFDVFDNASGIYVTRSPKTADGTLAKGSFFFNWSATGRDRTVVEDNVGSGFTTAVGHDKEFIAADSFPSGGGRVAGAPNNVYITWTVFYVNNKCGGGHPGGGYCQSPIFGSMSTNKGLTWSAPQEISGSSSTLCFFGDFFDPTLNSHKCDFDQGSDPVVLPNGKLVVPFNNGNTAAGNPNGQQLAVVCSPSGDSVAGTANLNCGAPVKVGDDIIVGEPLCDFGRGPEECVPGAFIRTNDFPRSAVNTSNGDLYVAWQDFSNGSSLNVRVAKSTNGGASWSMLGGGNGRINNDTTKHQYMPAIDFDENGGSSKIAVSYYRTPTGGSTTKTGTCTLATPKNSEYILAAGTTPSFGTSVVFGGANAFPPPDGAQCGFNGDYSGLTVTPDHMGHPVWSDTRNSAVSGNGVVHDEDIFTDSLALP